MTCNYNAPLYVPTFVPRAKEFNATTFLDVVAISINALGEIC